MAEKDVSPIGTGREPYTDIERVFDYDVHDKDGKSIGTVSAIWEDETGRPAFIGVLTSWLMGRTNVAPAFGADVNHHSHAVRLAYSEDVIKNAPSYDANVLLDEDERTEILNYYRGRGVEYPKPAEYEPEQRGAGTMALHEEEMKVGKRKVKAGGVRLRKIVRSKPVEEEVRLQREGIEVERRAATGRAPSEKMFEEEDIYIPLWREEPVVEKEVHVAGEVEARKTAEVERERVTGRVRREEVEVEKEEHPERRPEHRP